jgi:hypothetical protein
MLWNVIQNGIIMGTCDSGGTTGGVQQQQDNAYQASVVGM